MKEIMSVIYRDLRGVCSAEQSIYILIMELVCRSLAEIKAESQEDRDKMRLPEGEPWLCRGKARDLICGIEGYEIKEAVLMLDEQIDWKYIEMNSQTRRALLRAEKSIENLWISEEEPQRPLRPLASLDRLPEALLEVLDGAGLESPVGTTPESVRRLMGNAVGRPKPSWNHMAEFCCGSAAIGASISGNLAGDGQMVLDYYAEDILPFCSIFSKILLWASGIRQSTVMVRDCLKFDGQYTKKGQFDLIVADLPMGSNRNLPVESADPRVEGISPKTLYTDWVFIMDMLYRMSDTGRALALTTRGALIRKNERELREWVLDQDWLEAVVTLPANLYAHTNLERELIIFNKDKYSKKQVLFLDLSSYTERVSRNQCGITEEGLELARLLADLPWKVPETGSLDRNTGTMVDRDEIKAAGADWNPFRYLSFHKAEQDVGGGVALGEVASVTRGAQLSKAEEVSLASEGGGYFLNIKNISDGQINYDACPRIRPKSYGWEDKYRIREDDIIIATKGTVMKCALVPPEPPPAFICGNLTVVRVDTRKYHPYILYEYLQSETGHSYMEALQTGTTIKILNSSSLEKMTVPAYPMEVATRIGEGLKKEKLDYQERIKDMAARYSAHKELLLKELEERRNEENIY